MRLGPDKALCGTFAALAGLAASAPSPARAQDAASDAALDAAMVIQEHCAYLSSGNVEAAAGAVSTVAETWGEVSAAFERTQAAYLLYWRGSLAQCLSREEQARTDLQRFIDDAASTAFPDWRRQAQARLKRLGVKVRMGKGPASRWIRHTPRLGAEVLLGGGAGVDILACTDADVVDEVPRTENAGCVGGRFPYSPTTPILGLSHLAANLDLALHTKVGMGLKLTFDAPAALADKDDPSTAPPPRPWFRADFGVRLGGAGAESARDAERAISGATLFVGASVALGSLSPWSGNSKYTQQRGFLDAGSEGLLHIGPTVRLDIKVEADERHVLQVGVGGGFLPGAKVWAASPGASRSLRQDGWETPNDDGDDSFREEGVRIRPVAETSTRLWIGGRLAALKADDDRPFAFGPFLDVGWQRIAVRYPNDEGDVWLAVDSGGDLEVRKVYSTRRDEISARVGLVLQWGAGRVESTRGAPPNEAAPAATPVESPSPAPPAP